MGTGYAHGPSMRIRHHATDSRMARYWDEGDVFEVYADTGNLVLTLTGAQLMQWVQAQAAQAQIVIDLAQAMARLPRSAYPTRRLQGVHRALRGYRGDLPAFDAAPRPSPSSIGARPPGRQPA